MKNGEQVFEVVADDKAYRFNKLDTKVDHVTLHAKLVELLERVRKGELVPSNVVETDDMLKAIEKYASFPGLKPGALVVITVPKDVYSRTCYVGDDEQVHNRLEEYLRKRAGIKGIDHPERVRGLQPVGHA